MTAVDNTQNWICGNCGASAVQAQRTAGLSRLNSGVVLYQCTCGYACWIRRDDAPNDKETR